MKPDFVAPACGVNRGQHFGGWRAAASETDSDSVCAPHRDFSGSGICGGSGSALYGVGYPRGEAM